MSDKEEQTSKSDAYRVHNALPLCRFHTAWVRSESCIETFAFGKEASDIFTTEAG